MIRSAFLLLILMSVIVTGVESQEKIALDKRLAEAESILEKADSYTAIFHRQERIRGKLNKEETIFIKFKNPFKIYMKWIKEPFNGREVLYNFGWNKNRIKFHEGGVMGMINLNLDPFSSMGMNGNRHPITHSGLQYLVKSIEKDLRMGINAAESEIRENGEELIYGRQTKQIEVIFPNDQSKGYYCYRIVMRRH